MGVSVCMCVCGMCACVCVCAGTSALTKAINSAAAQRWSRIKAAQCNTNRWKHSQGNRDRTGREPGTALPEKQPGKRTALQETGRNYQGNGNRANRKTGTALVKKHSQRTKDSTTKETGTALPGK